VAWSRSQRSVVVGRSAKVQGHMILTKLGSMLAVDFPAIVELVDGLAC
jgi:hypothetical protein